MPKKKSKARLKRELRARIHAEERKAKRQMNQEKENKKGNKSEHNEEPPARSVSLPIPTQASNTQAKNPSKHAKKSPKIMRALEASGGGIIRLIALIDDHSGAVTAIATIVIALLTWEYVSISKRQWIVASDTLSISQRAYVTIGKKDGVVAEFVKSSSPKQPAELVVYFQNSGHLPAKLAWGMNSVAFDYIRTGAPKQVSGITYNHPFTGLPEKVRIKSTGAIIESGESRGVGTQSVTIAGDSVFAAPIGTISESDLDSLPTKDMQSTVMGTFQYCDDLGTNEIKDFWLGYRNAPSPELSFYLFHENDSVLNHIPRPNSTSELEYLGPCETAEERQKENAEVASANSLVNRALRFLRSKKFW